MLDTPAKRVLVAEDEALVAMQIEYEVAGAGFAVAGPFATCVEASRWLKADTPDVAVLDHELRDGPCTDLATELRRRSVPFVCLSASRPDHLPEVFRGVSWLLKPDTLERLPALLVSLLGT